MSDDWRERAKQFDEAQRGAQRAQESERRQREAEKEHKKWAKEEARRARELEEYQRTHFCAICGKKSSGPTYDDGIAITGYGGEAGIESYSQIRTPGYRYDDPMDLERCLKCHRWVCHDHSQYMSSLGGYICSDDARKL